MLYDKIVSSIETAPKTYLPALLVKIVRVAYAKNVFQPGGASRIIRKEEAGQPPNTKLNPKQAKGCPVKNMCGIYISGKCGKWCSKYPPEG